LKGKKKNSLDGDKRDDNPSARRANQERQSIANVILTARHLRGGVLPPRVSRASEGGMSLLTEVRETGQQYFPGTSVSSVNALTSFAIVGASSILPDNIG